MRQPVMIDNKDCLVRLHKDVHRKIKIVAAQQGTTMKDVVSEGFRLYEEKYRLSIK